MTTSKTTKKPSITTVEIASIPAGARMLGTLTGWDRHRVNDLMTGVAHDAPGYQGRDAWMLGTVIKTLASASISGVGDVDPDRMKPTDRKAWFDSEQRRLEVEQRKRTLIPAEEVETAMITLAAAVSQGLAGIPDSLERRLGLSPDVVAAIEDAIDEQRRDLAARVAALSVEPVADDE